MAQPHAGHSTGTNQDQDTGMTPKPQTEQDRAQAKEEGTQDPWSKRSGERDGAEARRRSREDPQVSGMPDPGED